MSRSSLSSGSLSHVTKTEGSQAGGSQAGGGSSSGSQSGSQSGGGGSSIYERLKWAHEFDHSSQKDLALGRRIGFYKFKSDLGAGNFSKVKLATHQLTKGRTRTRN